MVQSESRSERVTLKDVAEKARVAWRTSARPFITLEAVARETPAVSPTAIRVTRARQLGSAPV